MFKESYEILKTSDNRISSATALITVLTQITGVRVADALKASIKSNEKGLQIFCQSIDPKPRKSTKGQNATTIHVTFLSFREEARNDLTR